jgi:hypothetical protein
MAKKYISDIIESTSITGSLFGTSSWAINVVNGGGGGSTIAHLEFDNTDLTVWNNGKSNVDSNTSFGRYALKSNTSGNSNTAYGFEALSLNNIAGGNTAVGWQSLKDNSTGNENTAYGNTSLYKNTTGALNTAIGGATLSDKLTIRFFSSSFS